MVPLAVPEGWAWACPATHGGERSMLRLEPSSLAQGHSQRDGWHLALGKTPAIGWQAHAGLRDTAWPCIPSCNRTVYEVPRDAPHWGLQKPCSARHLCGSGAQPRIWRPPARRNKLRAPARPTTPHHPPQRAGAEQLAPARYGAAPARRRTAGAPPAPPLSPGSGRLKR